MTYLSKEQLRFLVQLSKTDKILCANLSDSQAQIAYSLEQEHLIDVEREPFPYLDRNTNQMVCRYGKRISVSVSEKGKACIRGNRIENLRYVITTAIALGALVIALIALFNK